MIVAFALSALILGGMVFMTDLDSRPKEAIR